MAEYRAQRFKYAGVSEWLIRGERCQLLKLRRRCNVRSRLVRHRGRGAVVLVLETAVGLRRRGATESGIDLGGERGGASRFQPGVSQPQCLGSGGLRQELRQCRGGRQLGSGQDRGIGHGAGECRTSLVEIAAEHGDAGDRQLRCDARGIFRQLSRPPIVRGGQIALLERDFGGQGLNRGQLTVLREEVVRDLGRLVQFAQLEERASEAGAGAGRGIAGEATLPAGTDRLGITRRKRQGGSLVQKRG